MNIRRKEPDYKRRFLRYVKFNFFFVEQSNVSLVHSQILTLSTLSLLREKSTTFDLLQGLNEIKKKKGRVKNRKFRKSFSRLLSWEKKEERKIEPFSWNTFSTNFLQTWKVKVVKRGTRRTQLNFLWCLGNYRTACPRANQVKRLGRCSGSCPSNLNLAFQNHLNYTVFRLILINETICEYILFLREKVEYEFKFYIN